MDTDGSQVNWRTIIPSAIIILILSIVLNIVVLLIYRVYVGFETRGDGVAIEQRANTFAASILFGLIISAILGLLVFWRGRAMARKLPESSNLMNMVIVVVIVLGISLVLGIAASPVSLGPLATQIVIQLVVGLLAAYTSTSHGGKSTMTT